MISMRLQSNSAPEVVEDGREHTTRPTRGSGHHPAAAGIFLGHCIGIGGKQGIAEDLGAQDGALAKERAGFAREPQLAGKGPLGLKASFDGIAHSAPDSIEEIPDILTLNPADIFPETLAALLTMVQDLGKSLGRVELFRFPIGE